MYKKLLTVFAASFLVFGVGVIVFYTTSYPEGENPVHPKSVCERSGGVWFTQTLSGNPECNIPTTDAGKACNDSSECQSYCQAKWNTPEKVAEGYCLEWTVPNCIRELKNGEVQEQRCAGVFQ